MFIGALASCNISLVIQKVVHTPRAVYNFQEQLKKALSPHSWLPLRFCTSWKKWLQQSFPLPGSMTKAYPTCTSSPLSKIRRFIGSRWQRKSLPNYQLTANLNDQRHQWPKMTKKTDFMELGQKDHRTAANSNKNKPWGGRDSNFRSSYIILFRLPNFQQKFMTHTEVRNLTLI